jgi:hypothetical protein
MLSQGIHPKHMKRRSRKKFHHEVMHEKDPKLTETIGFRNSNFDFPRV